MKKALCLVLTVLCVLLLVSCADGFLKPYPDHDESLIGGWSNHSTDTMKGDIYFFYSDFTFKHKSFKGWKDKENYEFYEPIIEEGEWSTKEGKLRLSTEMFDKKYEIIVKDSLQTYLKINKDEYLKI